MFQTKRQEGPGNRLGAIGLLAALFGAGGLIPQVPPSLLDHGAAAGWAFLLAGCILAVGGLVAEWKGLRRGSAIVPGLVLLGFVGSLAGWGAHRTVLAYRVEHVTIDQDGDARLTILLPRGRSNAASTVLLWGTGGDRGRLDDLARELARHGVATAWTEGATGSTPSLQRIIARLSAQAPPGPVGVLGFEAAGEAVVDAAAANSSVAFVVMVSTPIGDVERFSELATPLLGVWGMRDTEVQPHLNAQRLAEPLARGGHPDAMIRIFLGADHELRRPAAAPWLPAPFARGYVELLASWMGDRGSAVVAASIVGPGARPRLR